MPIYNFECTNEECKHVQEKILKMSDDYPPCDECKSEVKKLITAPKKSGLKFSGSGFHCTDY